jgi:hypothetical protein
MPTSEAQATGVCPFCASVVGTENAVRTGPVAAGDVLDRLERPDRKVPFEHRCQVAGMVLHLYGDPA